MAKLDASRMKGNPPAATSYRGRQSSFGDVLLLRATGIERDFPLHRHDYYAFGLLDEGVEASWARGSQHLITMEDTVLLNPEDAHTGAPYCGKWSYRMLILEPETVEALARDRCEDSGSPLFRNPIVHDAETRSKLAALMDVHEVLPDLLDEELVGLLSHFIVRHGGGDRGHEAPDDASALALVRDMLVDVPFRSQSLADLSAASNLSRTYLVTAFKRRYGLPPMAFQLQHRLDKARRDLLQGNKPIAQIAIENGFYDQSDLNHHFSRIFAISPFRMRRQVWDRCRT